MPTIAEQWIEQGREQGLEQGLEQGRATALKVLRRFLAQRFDVALDHFDTTLAKLDLATIAQLSDVAFDTKTLSEFETKLAELAVG